jgi:HD superfamily phosphohydrolase
MLNVVDDNLVVDHKGIYSIEKFLIARRLMYWQVYLHKTVLSSEILLLNILKRAKQLAGDDIELFTTPSLRRFLYDPVSRKDFLGGDSPAGNKKDITPGQKDSLDFFASLDDNDIMASVKVWAEHPDAVLSLLSNSLVNRRLYRIEIQNEEFSPTYIHKIKEAVSKQYGIENKDLEFLVYNGWISNNAYSSEDEQIKILYNNGMLKDIGEASDMLNVSVLSKIVKKYFLCYPKDALGSSAK